MTSPLQRTNPLLTWQAALIAVIAIGGAVAVYLSFTTLGSDDSSAIADDEQLIPAQIGDLINVVTTNGSLSYPSVEEAAFATSGKIGEILVAQGDNVTQGQPIARLDNVTVVGLALAVAQARLAIRDANDALTAAQAPAGPLAIATAQTTIAAAERDLELARTDLADLTDMTQVQTDIDTYLADLTNANANLGLVTVAQNNSVEIARIAAATMALDYVDEYVNWLSVPAEIIDATLSPADVLSAMGADLKTIFPTAQTDVNLALLGDAPTDDPATAWNEATIFRYVSFFPGAVVGECNGIPPVQGVCVRFQLDASWATLTSLRTAATTAELAAANAIDLATAPVTAATASLASAQETLAALESGVDSTAINLARATVASAQAIVDEAVTALADLNVAADPREIDVLDAFITVAELNLTAALEAQQAATLVAPIGGVITDIDMETGDSVGGTITIVDRSTIEIAGSVDEIDVLFIEEGAAAAIALTALPDQTFFGVITNIGAPENAQGVVTFPVTITVDVKQGVVLREGLTATATVLISQELDVLRVPTSAINGSFTEPFVRLSASGEVIERPVTLGSSDDFWVVVSSGLAEGDQVVMPAPSGSSFDKIDFGGANAGEILLKLQAVGGGKDTPAKNPAEPTRGK